MTLIEFIGFSTEVYNWLLILFIGALTVIEIRKFLKDKQVFRLVIVLPLIIGIIFAVPMSRTFSNMGLIALRVVGVASIVLYFFCDYKIRNKR